jgi:sortase A
MADRRRVDRLSVGELERLVLVRKRRERRSRTQNEHRPGRPRRPPDHTAVDRRRMRKARGPTGTSADGAAPSRPDASMSAARPGRLRDRALLVVEIALAVGLLGVLIASLRTLADVNRASREAQQLATPSPTPLIQVVLLPGGHTPPDTPGGAAPEEIPAHLRGRVAGFAPVPLPTPGPEHANRLLIPSIQVDAPVVEGDDWEALKQGAGHHLGSANPGEPGNCVISAHNDIFGEIFRRLPDVELGDEVTILTSRHAYRYVVTQKRIVDPEDVSVMFPTTSPVLTLISCYPYGVDTHRIVVTAELRT